MGERLGFKDTLVRPGLLPYQRRSNWYSSSAWTSATTTGQFPFMYIDSRYLNGAQASSLAEAESVPEFLLGGSPAATKPGTKTFPYQASPNSELQTVTQSVDLAAPPDQVWAVVGKFGGMWHPLFASIKLTGEGIGQLRTIETIDGKQIVERLEQMDNARRFYRYTQISGLGVVDYTGVFDLKPKGSGRSVEWRVQFLADNQPTLIVRTIVANLMKAGFEALEKRYGTLR